MDKIFLLHHLICLTPFKVKLNHQCLIQLICNSISTNWLVPKHSTTCMFWIDCFNLISATTTVPWTFFNTTYNPIPYLIIIFHLISLPRTMFTSFITFLKSSNFINYIPYSSITSQKIALDLKTWNLNFELLSWSLRIMKSSYAQKRKYTYHFFASYMLLALF